ncbi:MAG TPA: helix-turn-helix transcriptional regulator [Methanoregulaceae archaeon]|nr:helix-turn-helix transcriptional regulator [Methanoregulaceae archaeon]
MNNRIKVFRAINNLTQEDLAREIGVTRQTILALENRQYDPSLLLAARIARYFGKRIDEIFIIEDEEEPDTRRNKK